VSGVPMEAERWKRVEDLLQSALLVPADRRDEFLRQACGDDAPLLEEVQSLLTAHRQADNFLDQPLVDFAAQTATGEAAVSSRPSITGRTISHYRVLGPLASGGMGIVYRAEDIKLGRGVALKFLPGDLPSDRIAFERLQREARATSALDHPNICPIYELGEHNEQPFIAMQLLEGETLREWILNAPKLDTQLRLNRALDFGIQIADGLEAAHQSGIIHRDIKPANVFITTRGNAKILDFGLAKSVEDIPTSEPVTEPSVAGSSVADPSIAKTTPVGGDLGETHLTRTGTTMGTAYYMSPEQVRGEKLDARTDVFSLGLVLYEMVTGKRAFKGETGAAVYDAILYGTPTPVRQLNPAAPAELERIINKATEKDRTRRYRSAQEVEKDLKSLRAAWRHPVLWRNPKFIAVCAILLAVAAGVWVVSNRYLRPVPHDTATSIKARRSVAVLGFDNLGGRPETDWLSTGLSQMLTTELAAGGNLRLIPGEDVARAKSELHISESGVLSKYNLGRVRKNLGTDVVVFGSYTVLEGGDIRLDVRMQDAVTGEVVASLAETGNEKTLFDLVSLTGAAIRQKLGAGTAPASAESSIKASLPANPEAARLYSQGLEKLHGYDSLEARDLLLKAAELDPNHAGTHSALAEAWRNLGYDVNAQKEAQKAVDLSADLSKEDRLWYQGRSYEMLHQLDKAAGVYRTLFQSFPDGLEYGLRLGSVLTDGGKARDALATAELLRNLPSPYRDDPRIDLMAAAASGNLGDYKEQLALASRAEQMARLQEGSLVAARAINSQCGALQRLTKFQEAITACEEAYRIFNDAGDRAQAAGTLNSIALTLEDKGDFAEARSKFEEALAIAEKTGDNRSAARYLNNLGLNLWDRGDHAASMKADERSLKIALKVDDKIGATNTLGNIGLILVSMEDFKGARAKYEEALALARETGNKKAEASNQIHLAELSFYTGDLPATTRALQAADSLLEGTGDKRHEIYTLFTWGDVLFAQDDLSGAQKKYQEALDKSKEVGTKDLVAYSQMALAGLYNEQGRAADGAALAKAAADEYESLKSADFEIQALGNMVNSLLAIGKPEEASLAVKRGQEILSKIEDPQIKIDFNAVSARTDAALGNKTQAISELRLAAAEAHRHGAIGSEFEARLALGEIELQAGLLRQGKSSLEQLIKDAQTRGYLLIVRKANAALNNPNPSPSQHS
jgi:serine/threonine protein kinase/tetratricopeptide (TPR) repeat protein/TolB-like protein